MMCISPVSIPRPKGRGSHDRIDVPCGKCVACLNRRRSDWSVRLSQELRISQTAFFVTLTYSTPNLLPDGVNVDDVQKYIKRLRKHLEPVKIRYYLTAEYGSNTFRPHYHLIVFNVPVDKQDLLLSCWKKGFIYVGEVNAKTIGYVTKYIIGKESYPKDKTKPFSLMSKGLGKNYVESRTNWHLSDTSRFYVVLPRGLRCALPRYYRDKIYSKEDIQRYSLVCKQRSSAEVPAKRFLPNGDNVFVLSALKKQDYTAKKLNDLKRTSKL